MNYRLYNATEFYIIGHGLNMYFFLSERFVQIKLESGSMI